MDRGKKPSKFLGGSSNKIYWDLKSIIRENALPFLPAKSLFRFQAVCKEWKNKVLTPFFAHSQSYSFGAISGFFRQVPGEPPSFISIDKDAYGVPEPSLSFLPEPVDVQAASNGLICCQGRTGDKAYYIVNPVTKQFKKLPKPNADHGFNPAVVLVFKPSLLDFVPDYKVVCAFPCAEIDDALEFEMYTSAEGSWRSSGEILFGNGKLVLSSGVGVDDIVYWIGKYGRVVSFDVRSERSQFINSAYRFSGENQGTLGVINGKLCTVNVRYNSFIVNVLANAYTNTMSMDSTVSAWDSKEIMVTNLLPSGTCLPCGQITVLFAGIDVILYRAGTTLLSYDMKTGEIKEVGSADGRLIPYVNSLVYF